MPEARATAKRYGHDFICSIHVLMRGSCAVAGRNRAIGGMVSPGNPLGTAPDERGLRQGPGTRRPNNPVPYCEYDGDHNLPSFGVQAVWDFFKAL